MPNEAMLLFALFCLVHGAEKLFSAYRMVLIILNVIMMVVALVIIFASLVKWLN